MSAFLLRWFRLIWLFTRGHQALVLENLALRQQLAVYKRNSKRPRLNRSDRMFWIALAGVWKGWRRVLVLVHPDTVVRWQRQRFRRYWAQLSGKPNGKVGRPSIGKFVRNLIQTMVRANPLWRAPRIHGELLKLGIRVSERTVSRILRTVTRPPSQSWKTFLRNHTGGDHRDRLLHRSYGPDARTLRVHRPGASPAKGASLRSHGTSDLRMGRAAGGRGIRRAGASTISDPRP